MGDVSHFKCQNFTFDRGATRVPASREHLHESYNIGRGPVVLLVYLPREGTFTSHQQARGPVVLPVNLPREGARVRPPTRVYSLVYGPDMTVKHTSHLSSFKNVD